MPPRLNKRQLRELEELSALSSPKDGQDPDLPEEGDDDEDELVTAPKAQAASGFKALMSQDADAEETDEDDAPVKSKSKKSKKKKKKDSGGSNIVTQPQSTSSPGPSKKDKKALKKQKAKEKKDDPLDLDKALAELSVKYPDLHPTSPGSGTKSPEDSLQDFSTLLAVSVQNLDSEVEMRKFFGAKIIAASKANASDSTASNARRQNIVQRSHLTRPKRTWWPAQLREGLSIRQLTAEENTDKLFRHGWSSAVNETWWAVEYSKKYRGITSAFMHTVMSGDPEGFNSLLRALPYHADTLLQLSEVYNHREEYSTAADFVNRALFSYERSFLGSFNFTSGLNRLDFDRVENRPFFLALHRQIADLQRRGCNRTAFEFSKLLYSLDPWSDPHGSLLHLDSLAIRAGMSEWLLEMWNFFESHTKGFENRCVVTALPGWWYSRALALRVKGDEEGSTKALKEAIRQFPSILPLLADKTDLSLSGDIRGHRNFRIHTDASSVSTRAEAMVQLLCHLYVQRAFQLWKKPDLVKWISETVASITASLLVTPTPENENTIVLLSLPLIQFSIYRHVLVLEQSTRHLFPFLPKDILNARQVACDPLPPPSRINEYNTDFFKGTEDVLAYNPHRRNRREDQRMLERLIPDPVFRRQLQAFFEAHPQFAGRFPGGIVQFAQIAAQLPEDALEDMMIAETDNIGEPNREMPGQMPGQLVFGAEDPPLAGQDGGVDLGEDELEGIAEDADEDDEDDGDDGDGEVAPLPVRLLRNMVHRFFGGSRPVEAEESDSDEDAPRDQEGVD